MLYWRSYQSLSSTLSHLYIFPDRGSEATRSASPSGAVMVPASGRAPPLLLQPAAFIPWQVRWLVGAGHSTNRSSATCERGAAGARRGGFGGAALSIKLPLLWSEVEWNNDENKVSCRIYCALCHHRFLVELARSGLGFVGSGERHRFGGNKDAQGGSFIDDRQALHGMWECRTGPYPLPTRRSHRALPHTYQILTKNA